MRESSIKPSLLRSLALRVGKQSPLPWTKFHDRSGDTSSSGSDEMLDLSRKTKHSFWTVLEIAELTGLSESTVRRSIRGGQLGSVKLKGSRLIRHSQLVEFLGFDPLEEAALVESFRFRNSRPNAEAETPTLFEMT